MDIKTRKVTSKDISIRAFYSVHSKTYLRYIKNPPGKKIHIRAHDFWLIRILNMIDLQKVYSETEIIAVVNT